MRTININENRFFDYWLVHSFIWYGIVSYLVECVFIVVSLFIFRAKFPPQTADGGTDFTHTQTWVARLHRLPHLRITVFALSSHQRNCEIRNIRAALLDSISYEQQWISCCSLHQLSHCCFTDSVPYFIGSTIIQAVHFNLLFHDSQKPCKVYRGKFLLFSSSHPLKPLYILAIISITLYRDITTILWDTMHLRYRAKGTQPSVMEHNSMQTDASCRHLCIRQGVAE